MKTHGIGVNTLTTEVALKSPFEVTFFPFSVSLECRLKAKTIVRLVSVKSDSVNGEGIILENVECLR